MAWPRFRKALRAVTIVAAVTLLLFLVLEGAASVFFTTRMLFFREVGFMRAEQAHAEYDELLGWVNRPNVHLPDLYGPGIGFRSNTQRFRADHDYPVEPPPGVSRVICSGDSFTMGHSVADDETWCALLGTTVPGVETVNMGMAAYGIDQAFLWYRRDGVTLQHNLQIFAFITPDFQRMASGSYGDYPKPYLELVDGRLEVRNVPVPQMFSLIPQRERVRSAVRNLNLVQFGHSVLDRLGAQSIAPEWRVMDDNAVRAVSAKVFEELRDLNAARGSTLVLVYLPRTGDSSEGGSTWAVPSDDWRAFVRREADRLGIRFIDLVEAFRELPLDVGEQLFIEPYQPSHYNTRGNAWVAQQLRERLFAPEADIQ
jgi:hypothetical protein